MFLKITFDTALEMLTYLTQLKATAAVYDIRVSKSWAYQSCVLKRSSPSGSFYKWHCKGHNAA